MATKASPEEKLLDKLEKLHGQAVGAFHRYMLRPATTAGSKAYDRYEKLDTEFDETVKKLRSLLANGG